MTKKTKEAIKTTAVIVIVLAAVFILWIYPLNQAGKLISRPEAEPEAIKPEQYGLVFDTLSFVSEDNLHLAGMILKPGSEQVSDSAKTSDSIRGTFVLVHGLFGAGSSQLKKAAALIEAGYKVIIYDQRAYGRSEGQFRSGGFYETNDLQEVLYRLDLEDRLTSPVIVWGEDHGATAALRAWAKQEHIDYIIAESPIVDGRDWQKRVRDHDDRSAPNLMLGIIWWWMKQKSGYEISSDEIDISDAFGTALVDRQDRFMIIACGNADIPDNPYLAELKAMGGNWLVAPCPEDATLLDTQGDMILSAIMDLID